MATTDKKSYPKFKSIKKNNLKKVFLVRHYNPEENKTSQVGPFADEGEALEAVKAFLKKGTCSWLVSYGS